MSAIVSIAGSLPKELPLLLIGAGLGNLSLAQTLRKSGLATPSHIRIFDQFRATSRPSYSLTLHPWGYEDIQEVVGDKKPIAFCAVDASLGGKGRVERRVFDIETGATVGRIDGYGDKSIRVNRGVLGQMLKDGLSIDFEKKFERFEAVRDEDGREAIRAWFVDGESVLGSGIIAGDGVHSKVRQQLLPSVEPDVLPIVCYTGQGRIPSQTLLQGKPIYRTRTDNDVLQVDVFEHGAYASGYNTFTKDDVRIQWVYLRLPLSEDDPLWNPARALGQAKDIPEELFDELRLLRAKTREHYKTLIGDTKKGEGDFQYNWLLRSLRLPPTEELAELKRQVAGGDKIHLIGDSAHAMPIFLGEGGNTTLVDGVTLGTSLAEAITTSSDVHAAINAWTAASRNRWEANLSASEDRLAYLFRSREEWKGEAKAIAGA